MEKLLIKILGYVFTLWIPQLEANNLFMPLPDGNKPKLSLVKWTPTQLRIQYHGFMEFNGHKRYIFRVDREIVYLQLDETAKQQFILKQILSNGRQVLIEDILTKHLHILNSGETSYTPDKFECTLLDKKSQQQLTFSDTKKQYKADNLEILIAPKGSLLHVWEIDKNKEPILYSIPIIPSK